MPRFSTIRIAPAFSLAAAMLVAACASEPEPPTFGERLSAEATEVSALGAQWTRGDALIAEGRTLIEDGRDKVDSGERMVSKGKKRIRAGRQEIDYGEALVARGRDLKQEARELYGQRSSGDAGES